jgi:hypothetical protein
MPEHPTPEELAAMVAAVEVAWPRAERPAPAEPQGSSPWRFSGRWWSLPVIARRDRPWARRLSR